MVANVLISLSVSFVLLCKKSVFISNDSDQIDRIVSRLAVQENLEQ